MKNKIQMNLLVPLEVLSAQQKQIYKLHSDGFSNKDIAGKLNIEQRSVAAQLSRIRKKAAALDYTYKIKPGAESDGKWILPNSPADELKKKIQEDPGFFSLMFNRYAVEQEPVNENKFQLASAIQDSVLLTAHRIKKIKTIAASGCCSRHDQIAVKLDQESRHKLSKYLQNQKLRPAQMFWDDGSAIYLMTTRELENIRNILDNQTNT